MTKDCTFCGLMYLSVEDDCPHCRYERKIVYNALMKQLAKCITLQPMNHYAQERLLEMKKELNL